MTMDIAATHRSDDDIERKFNQSQPKSAASWGAITAGALVAVALSLVLVTLGTGLGIASISTPPYHGLDAGTFTVTAAIWLIVTQWVSSLLGGYITGRLRTRWVGTHEHEIFFRDTANGLVMWALATVAVAVLLSSSVSSALSGGAKRVPGPGSNDPRVEATADLAGKDGAEAAIYTALSMLIGAFIASASAALGGRLRDEHP